MSEHTNRPNHRLAGAVIILLVTASFWLTTPPSGLTEKAWHLLGIFLGTMLGLILQPLPMGAVVLVGVTLTILTDTLSIADALNGYANSTVWLIVAAFLFARGFSKTGLGRRIAYVFIRSFGRRTLGLAYALGLADLVLAPGIPSGTARTGGVLFPIVKSLATAYGSEPGPTAGRIGSFLMMSAYNVHAVTCSMFMTSMVANPLIVEMTRKATGIQITWAGWAVAAIVPGLISFFALPFLVMVMTKPEIRETPEATKLAHVELGKMGPMRRDEWIVLGVFLLAFTLWITGSWTNLDPTGVALLGLCIMLGSGVITWEDVISERPAWDALIWFGGLVGIATMLGKVGLMDWFTKFVGSHLNGLPWFPVLGILALVYLYVHYFFASLSAHTTALFAPFLAVAIGAGAPPYFAALIFAFFSSLCASLTHYGGGPSPVYYGAGYVDVRKWWKIGFSVSLLFIVVWMGIGPFWWKLLGLF
jgi:DASS family divalent anion:Na+ symporter